MWEGSDEESGGVCEQWLLLPRAAGCLLCRSVQTQQPRDLHDQTLPQTAQGPVVRLNLATGKTLRRILALH